MADFNKMINSDKPVLVDFYADWCGPCKMMAPILKELKSALGPKINIVKVDVEKNQRVAGVYGVRGVPTLILFQNGEIKWRQAGVVPAAQLEQIIGTHALTLQEGA